MKVPPSWHENARPFPEGATIVDLVAAGNAIDPSATAVAGDGERLTHREVAAMSNQIARSLVKRGIGRGSLVGLLTKRTPRAVVGLLGTLTSGAAYVPLDIRWPRARLEELIRRHGIRALLIDESQTGLANVVKAAVPSVEVVLSVDDGPAEPWRLGYDPSATKLLWNEVASAPDLGASAGFNFGQTGGPAQCDPFDRDAITGYRDHADSLVRGVVGRESNVLEIGCGTGLVATALSGWVDRYIGADPSPVAIERLMCEVEGRPSPVEAHVSAAHDVSQVVSGPVDVALLSSVVHFFPGTWYFERVLDELAEIVRPGGSVILADLVHPEQEEHSGLRIHPDYLERLVAEGRIDTLELRHRDDTDLHPTLRQRYDAILTLPAPGTPRSTAGSLVAAADTAAEPIDPVTVDISPTDLAYIIFTSGSTGEPKGVMVEHRSVANLIDWVNRDFGVTAADHLLFVTSFAFDLSVYDMFGILAAGGSLHVASDEDVAEPDRLADLLESEPITFWDSAPAALSAVMSFLDRRPPVGRNDLRLAFLSGDWVPLTMFDLLQRNFDNPTFIALGGATECTVWSNSFLVDRVEPEWPSIPYGQPMQNASYYVLDEQLVEEPVGKEGDLYIAGDCVARGYAGDPALTAERFLDDTVRKAPGRRMYRTGDRARWLPDGNLQFLGRLDNQVKIRGYRVELGEIQSALNRCDGVLEGVTLAVEGEQDLSIAAFFVPAPESGASEASVRAQLAAILPSYLVPGLVRSVPQLPVSATGKVDRATLLSRLQDDRGEGASSGAATVAASDPPLERAAPDDPIEQAVWEAWVECTDTTPSEPPVTFFEAGGTSLTATRFAALISELTGAEISVRDVYALLEFEAIADHVGRLVEVPAVTQ